MGGLIAGLDVCLFSGGMLTLGLFALVTGRAPFNMWRQAWTRAKLAG